MPAYDSDSLPPSSSVGVAPPSNSQQRGVPEHSGLPSFSESASASSYAERQQLQRSPSPSVGNSAAPLAPPPPPLFVPAAKPAQSVAAAAVSALPLHRRVQLPGVPGRFLRGVLSALAGAVPGSQHLLLDVTWTPPAAQLDGRALAHWMAATGALFGLSCDMLVCHAGTTPADLTHGAPQMQQQQQQQQQHAQSLPPPLQRGSSRPWLDRNVSTASSVSGAVNFVPAGSMGNHLASRASPEPGPTSQYLKAHPPAAGSQPAQLRVSAVGAGDGVALASFASPHHGMESDFGVMSPHEDDNARAAATDVPSPPPLGSLQVHAPRRQSSHSHTLVGAGVGGGSGGARGHQHTHSGSIAPSLSGDGVGGGGPGHRRGDWNGGSFGATALSIDGSDPSGVWASALAGAASPAAASSSALEQLSEHFGFQASGSPSPDYYPGGGASATAGFNPSGGPTASSSSSSSAPQLDARGPIFSNIFIAHHLHNAPRDVQDVLLQALRIKQISVDGLPVNLPAIHLCIATHSASVTRDGAGISPRLMDEFVLDIMADSSFFHTLSTFLQSPPAPTLLPELLPIPWAAIRQLVNEDESSRGIFLSNKMGQYARDVAIALRQHGRVALGPSPQAMQAFIHAAKCHAFFGGCGFVRPVDIDSVAESALCHRLMLRAPPSQSGGSTTPAARMLIQHIIGKVMLPPK